jgi:hypothetical protein
MNAAQELRVGGRPRADAVGSQDFGQAPVHDLDLAERADHHVGGLDVAMDHVVGVGVAQRLGDCFDERQGVELAGEGQPLVERLPLDELHGQKRPAVGEGRHAVDGRDAGVLQLRGDACFFDEARRRRRSDGITGLQDLDGDLAVQLEVAGAADVAHAAAADAFAQLVARHDGGQVGPGPLVAGPVGVHTEVVAIRIHEGSRGRPGLSAVVRSSVGPVLPELRATGKGNPRRR